MTVKVSVVVAVHNDEKNLANALEALKNQTLKNIEVIMIDAASSDSSLEIMNSFTADKRFKVYQIDQNSFSLARNLGIEKACGKYISFCDASVIFTKNLIEGMYDCAEREQAQLCVAPMASSDIYGKHEFKSTDILSRRKKTDKFDTDLIWTPSVTNKLFLRSKIIDSDFKFSSFGKAREAAFTLPFAFESDVIACSSKGATCYLTPVQAHGVAEFPIEQYLNAYAYIIEKAEIAFENAIENAVSDFDRKELKKKRTCYIDEIFLKEITVLLYSYYRHFWSLTDENIKKYSSIIMSLSENLSSRGKKTLLDMNKDIFYGDKLISTKEEMAKNPRATVCIGKSMNKNHVNKERLYIQVSSIFNQTMPCFELFVDDRLKHIFPKEWIEYPNVKFIHATSLGEFKDLALENSQTGYIMYQDGFARLNPKILMRHYQALAGKEKYGFTTSPLTKFDGKHTQEYSFSDLSFYYDMDRTRVSDLDRTFVLDLFFCNKLFRTDHLNGIHFSFSDNPVFDMYKLYEHSKFKKLSHRGAYLSYTEDEALNLLKSQQGMLPLDCKQMYRKYKYFYYKMVTVKKQKAKFVRLIKSAKKKIISLISFLSVFVFSHMKIKDRVFFYSIRSDGKLLENIRYVYDDLDAKKIVFAKMLPHSLKDIFKIKFYMLTSKVIVTDDYMKYLRNVRLRDGQKVVQLWHASGAFKRFGLDAPSKLSRIEEFNTHSQYSDVCVSSEYVRQFYAHAFGIDLDIVKPLGSPRTDFLVNKELRSDDKQQIIARHPLLKDKKVYIYFPTFREDDGVVCDFDPQIDWSKLNDELNDDEVFIVSRHPVMKKEFFKNVSYSRVKDYTFEPTPSLLSVADVVITDYSSIIFDASLLNMPMVFYCCDFGKYERDFYLDYATDLPGEMVIDSNDLLEKIRQAVSVDRDSEKMKLFREKEVGSCDGHSTERIVKLIENYLN